MRAELLNPSDYLKSAEFEGSEPTYTIRSVGMEELVDDKGGKKTKGVIHFKETPKGLVSNVINVKCIAAMFGDETNGWVGKRLTLYEDRNVESFGETVSGIRVRGSPDLPKDLTIRYKVRGKKEPKTLVLKKTGAQSSPPAKASKGSDAGAEVIFSKHPLHGRKLAELTVEELRSVMAAAQEASKAPSLTTDQLASLDRQAQAVENLLAERMREGAPPAEPGAGG